MVYNLTGQTFEGKVRCYLRPGFGVWLVDAATGQGTHTEGGPHDIPVEVAAHLIEDKKAFYVNEDDEPVLADGTVVTFPSKEDEA